MNLFKNRPFALFCLIFISTASLVYALSAELKIIMICALLLCLGICAGACALWRNIRIKSIYASLCLGFALLAVVSQLLFIDVRKNKALEYTGDRNITFVIISEGYSSERSSEYDVRITDIGGESVSLRSVVVFGFESEYESGTEICARTVIYESGDEILGYSRSSNADVYIHAAVYDREDHIVVSSDNLTFEVLMSRVTVWMSDYMDDTFGGETSALSRGFLLGDTDDIGSDILRDFRRAGVSHLLAVSGLHISVLIGAVELLFRRFGIPKGARSVLLSFISMIFLAMTGFSMSACRSVIMILCVYFSYLFVKENDAVTALFTSVAAIMLFSPHSVRDVGLWLSFLATLGIVAVYTPLSLYYRKPPKKTALSVIVRWARRLLLAAMLTFICNAFICVVVWLVFGEMSVVSLASNIILAPLSEIFIIVIPLAALVGRIPIIGRAAVGILGFFGDVIVEICGIFSDIDGAVISLKYPFVGYILIPMGIALAVMLVIKLKKKWLILIPPISACLAFGVCLGAYVFMHRGETKAFCYSSGKNEMIVLTEGSSAAVCDLSSGAYSFLRNASVIAADNMATEIDEYVITHYHSRQVVSMDRLFRSTMLRRVYLPYPKTMEDIEIMSQISDCAKEQGVRVMIYRYGDATRLLNGTSMSVLYAPSEEAHGAISVSVWSGESMLSYVSAGNESPKLFGKLISESDHIIFGSHGTSAWQAEWDIDGLKGTEKIYFTDRSVLPELQAALPEEIKLHSSEEEDAQFSIILK